MPGSTLPRGNIVEFFAVGVTLTPASVAASTSAEQTFTVPGLRVGDLVRFSVSVAQTAGIGAGGARVSAANTLVLLFENNSTGALTPVSAIYQIVVMRPENVPLPTSAV